MRSYSPLTIAPITHIKFSKQTLLSRFPKLRPLRQEISQKDSHSSENVLKVIRRCIYRSVFKKFRALINSFCANMNSFLLQYISPRLAKLVKGRTNNIEVMFRLSGNS